MAASFVFYSEAISGKAMTCHFGLGRLLLIPPESGTVLISADQLRELFSCFHRIGVSSVFAGYKNEP